MATAQGPAPQRGYGLFPSGTYWGDCERICRGASDEALIQTAYVAFQGGNGMVYPTQEILHRYPLAVAERDKLKAENARLRSALSALRPSLEALLNITPAFDDLTESWAGHVAAQMG